MAYDEELTEISRDQLGFMDGVSEKNMMGGNGWTGRNRRRRL